MILHGNQERHYLLSNLFGSSPWLQYLDSALIPVPGKIPIIYSKYFSGSLIEYSDISSAPSGTFPRVLLGGAVVGDGLFISHFEPMNDSSSVEYDLGLFSYRGSWPFSSYYDDADSSFGITNVITILLYFSVPCNIGGDDLPHYSPTITVKIPIGVVEYYDGFNPLESYQIAELHVKVYNSGEYGRYCKLYLHDKNGPFSLSRTVDLGTVFLPNSSHRSWFSLSCQIKVIDVQYTLGDNRYKYRFKIRMTGLSRDVAHYQYNVSVDVPYDSNLRLFGSPTKLAHQVKNITIISSPPYNVSGPYEPSLIGPIFIFHTRWNPYDEMFTNPAYPEIAEDELNKFIFEFYRNVGFLLQNGYPYWNIAGSDNVPYDPIHCSIDGHIISTGDGAVTSPEIHLSGHGYCRGSELGSFIITQTGALGSTISGYITPQADSLTRVPTRVQDILVTYTSAGSQATVFSTTPTTISAFIRAGLTDSLIATPRRGDVTANAQASAAFLAERVSSCTISGNILPIARQFTRIPSRFSVYGVGEVSGNNESIAPASLVLNPNVDVSSFVLGFAPASIIGDLTVYTTCTNWTRVFEFGGITATSESRGELLITQELGTAADIFLSAGAKVESFRVETFGAAIDLTLSIRPEANFGRAFWASGKIDATVKSVSDTNVSVPITLSGVGYMKLVTPEYVLFTPASLSNTGFIEATLKTSFASQHQKVYVSGITNTIALINVVNPATLSNYMTVPVAGTIYSSSILHATVNLPVFSTSDINISVINLVLATGYIDGGLDSEVQSIIHVVHNGYIEADPDIIDLHNDAVMLLPKLGKLTDKRIVTVYPWE